ncbi:AKR1C1 isoform 3 [Pan troglodytes]|uniref:AKR1C1 isoform 3 n=1 Tax=Pan troglodytes TaxID=9598 RepID=A0A2J8KTW5_PANTR|nr:AKR1C1 isoform 3 [Pan troglodytes]
MPVIPALWEVRRSRPSWLTCLCKTASVPPLTCHWLTSRQCAQGRCQLIALIACEGGRKKHLPARPVTEMDSKYQCVKLNDGHFMPVLGFGTYAPPEVECHPYFNQRKLLDFCKSKDIVLVAYSALGSHREEKWVDPNSPVLLEDPVLCALAKKHKRTPALIALRYQLQRGVVVLAKSYNEQRIRQNMQVFEFQLTSEDMKAIDGLNRNVRYLTLDM